ncbi:unnamed protein product [Merluccius merluccius]
MNDAGLLAQDWQEAFIVALRWARRSLPRVTEDAIDDARARLSASASWVPAAEVLSTGHISAAAWRPSTACGYTARDSTTGPHPEAPPTFITTCDSTTGVSAAGPDAETPPPTITTRGHTARDSITSPHTGAPPTTITIRDSTAGDTTSGPDSEAPSPTTITYRPRHLTCRGSSAGDGGGDCR